MKKKILFFLTNLSAGGRERRVIELINYIETSTDLDFKIVLTDDIIHYKDMFKFRRSIEVIKRKFKYDPSLFLKFYLIAKKYKPNIIHTWSGLTTLYAVPTSKILSIVLINSQIADAVGINKTLSFNNLIWIINKRFSTYLLSNSKAGINAYSVSPQKSAVIYNGLDFDRFKKLDDIKVSKKEFNIGTKYAIVMVARMDYHKDFDSFIDIANKFNIRNDITFVAAGNGVNYSKLRNKVLKMKLKNFIFTGRISNVEELINCCDIGILFTNDKNHQEGISNTILEYMSLSKPTIANCTGGTSEIIINDINGYLLKKINIDDVCEKISYLLENKSKRLDMGNQARSLIEKKFNVSRMGREFISVYEKYLNEKNTNKHT